MRFFVVAYLVPLALVVTALSSLAYGDPIGSQRLVISSPDLIDTLTPRMQRILVAENGSRDRDLMLRIWYPAERPRGQTPEHYGFHTDVTDFGVDPDSAKDFLPKLRRKLRRSRTFQNAAPNIRQPRPVILYSHGNGNAAEANEPYFEALVKRGYVVVSVGHSFAAGLVTLQDGRIATRSPELQAYFNSEVPEDRRDPDRALTDAAADQLAALPFGQTPPDDLLNRYHYEVSQVRTGSRAYLRLWVADIAFALRALETLNAQASTPEWHGLFDLSRIGAVGHSFGGAAARHFCDLETRCKVSINMDGTDPARRSERIRAPHMRYYFDVDAQIAQELRNGARDDPEFIALVRKLFSQRQRHETHAMISARDSDLVVVSPTDISHLDFTFGWVDFHRHGPGKRVWHRTIRQTSLPFLDLYLQPQQTQNARRELCRALNRPRRLTVMYQSLCD